MSLPSYVGIWKGRDFLNTQDYTQEEINMILDVADDLRNKFRSNVPTPYLPGRTVFLLFYNESLRTRNSMEAGIFQLGGHGHFIRAQDVYKPTLPEDRVPYKTEDISDVARVLSRFGQGIAIRMYADAANWIIGRANKIINLFAQHATIPVINLEDDMYHPLQALADMQAARTVKPKLKGKKFVMSYAYSGGLKPLAVPQSVVLAATQMGMEVVLAHPKGFELDDKVIQQAKENAERYGGSFKVEYDMKTAFEGATFVYPKAWSPKEFFQPYGPKKDEEGAKAYQSKFKDWIVTMDLLERSGKPYYMHCGPADRGQEVTDEVLDTYENSLYFDEAENRLHTAKAVMSMILP